MLSISVLSLDQVSCTLHMTIFCVNYVQNGIFKTFVLATVSKENVLEGDLSLPPHLKERGVASHDVYRLMSSESEIIKREFSHLMVFVSEKL